MVLRLLAFNAEQWLADRLNAYLVLSVAPVEGDGVLRVFGREDVFGARRSGWWAASG
jgi:hypothetical protein